MKALPLRIKLTAWYFAVLAATLSLFGAVAFYAMRGSIHETVDEDLRERVKPLRGILERHAGEGFARLAHDLKEHSRLDSKSSLLQVADARGQWLYRSESAIGLNVPASRNSNESIATITSSGMPFRILSTGLRVDGQTFYVQIGLAMDDYYEAIHRFGWMLLLTAPVVVLLASAGGYWMSRRSLTPVDQIITAVRHISAQNLSSRLVVPRSGDELERLSETLNGMLERLEAAFKRITQFTADASHELRTPVALVRTRAELALRKPRSESEYRESLSQILKETERTSDLIDRLMFLARADSGAESVPKTRLDLVEAVREACDQGQALAEAKQISFKTNLPDHPIWMEGDLQSLERVFLILIDNAAKYTPAQGEVSVSLTAENGHALGEVRDTGIGISEMDLPNIFERFYRADKARSRESGGAGLGLSIGRWITEAHGGVIEAQSKAGQGSVFRVRLPVDSA